MAYIFDNTSLDQDLFIVITGSTMTFSQLGTMKSFCIQNAAVSAVFTVAFVFVFLIYCKGSNTAGIWKGSQF